MGSPIRGYLRYLGLSTTIIMVVLLIPAAFFGHWPNGLDAWAFYVSVGINLVFMVEGIGLWWYLRRQRSSLQNIGVLVFRYGVSWGYLSHIEKRVEPRIALVKKHCPEFAASGAWQQATSRNDYIALAVLAERALRRNKRTIDQSLRREAQHARDMESEIATLRSLGASDEIIGNARNGGLPAMRALRERMQKLGSLKQRAETLGFSKLVAESLAVGDVDQAEKTLNRAKALLDAAKTLDVRRAVVAHLAKGEFEAAEKELGHEGGRRLHESFVSDVEAGMRKLPGPVQAELRGMISALNGNTIGSKAYKIAKRGLERRLAQASSAR